MRAKRDGRTMWLRGGSGGGLEQLSDECCLCLHIPPAYLLNLFLPHHRYHFVVRQRSSCRPEAAEAHPWSE